jgi:hypothetical protein
MNTLPVAAKVRASLSIAVLGIAVLAAAPQAHGQVSLVKVNIPFGFENGSQYLPAGPYTINTESQSIMRIRGNSGGMLALTRPEENFKAATAGKVVFHRYGDRYFLREVWVAGSTTHLQCPKSRSEKRLEVARNAAATGEEVALVETPR